MTGTTTTFRVGDEVTVSSPRFPGVWTIEKVNKVNIKLVQGQRRLNASPTFLTKVTSPGTEPSTPLFATVAEVGLAPVPVGTLVTVRGRDGYWVVIKDGFDRVNVARLGGDDARYLRAARSLVTVVTDFTVTEGVVTPDFP
jgi:hypothetical protein